MDAKSLITSLVLAISVGFTATSMAETRYISSTKANLLTEPDFKATKIAKLNKGEEVTIETTQGPWLKVTTINQQNGWLSKFLTKTTPPIDRITVLPGKDASKLKDVRRRTSAITSAAAARGLAASSRGSKEDLYKSDEQAVVYMESFNIQEDDLDIFAEEIGGDR